MIRYAVPGRVVWHERLLLAIHPRILYRAYVLTPDGDRYVEDFQPSADVAGALEMAHQGAVPSGVATNTIYRFRELPPQVALDAFAFEGASVFGLPAPTVSIVVRVDPSVGGVPAPERPPPIRDEPPAEDIVPGGGDGGIEGTPTPRPSLPAGHVWVAMEDRGTVVQRGDLMVGAPLLCKGDRGIFELGGLTIAAASMDRNDLASFLNDDLRTLAVKFDPQGERRREYADALTLMSDEAVTGGFPVQGPRTCLKQLKAFRDHGGSAVGAHEKWVATARIPDGDRSIHEHECLAKILDAAVMIDQVNLPSMVSFEYVCRRMALIKAAHRVNPASPDYSAADHFMGWGARRGAADPALEAHVAGQLRDEAAVLKESRKAREERRLTRTPKGKGKKGKDKGDGAADPDHPKPRGEGWPC